MALTPEQTAALATAADALKGAADSDVADALKDVLPAPYQSVYARGFGTHKGESKTEVDTLKAQIATLTTERDEAKADAATAGQGDAAAAEKVARLEKALTDARAAATDATTTANTRIKALHSARERAALVADLVAQGMDADYAEQVAAPKLAARIRVGEPGDDGTAPVDYLDADGLTPLQSGRKGLAEAAVKTADPKWLTSTVASGGGTGTPAAGTSGAYDPVKAGRDMAAAQKGEAADKGLALK